MNVSSNKWESLVLLNLKENCFNQRKFQFRNHKFSKRGFLSIALTLDEIDDEDSEKIQLFDETVETIFEKCGNIKISDRCENALEVAKCFDRILELGNAEKNLVFDDKLNDFDVV